MVIHNGCCPSKGILSLLKPQFGGDLRVLNCKNFILFYEQAFFYFLIVLRYFVNFIISSEITIQQ